MMVEVVPQLVRLTPLTFLLVALAFCVACSSAMPKSFRGACSPMTARNPLLTVPALQSEND
jgi:hypothetical protein